MGMYSRIFLALVFLFFSDFLFADPVANTGQFKGYAVCQFGATYTPCQSDVVINGPTSIDPSTGNTVYAWSSGFSNTYSIGDVTYQFDSVIDNNFAWYIGCPAGMQPTGSLQCSCPDGQQQDPFSSQCVTPPVCDVGYSVSWTSNGPICASDASAEQSSSSSSLPPCSTVEPPYIVGSTCVDDSGSSSSDQSHQSSVQTSSVASSVAASDSGSGTGSSSGGTSGGDSGGGSSSGGSGSNPDTCDLYPDSPICGSSSSSGPDCPPGYDYYPGTYTCVPISSSSSISIASSSSIASSQFNSQSSASASVSSISSANFSSSSSWYSDHNGETPIAENDPCPNKYQDNQGQWWCVNDTGGQGSSAASQSSATAVAWTDCDQRPVCDDGSTACAQLYQEWQTRCAGVAQWDQHQFDQPDDKNDITFSKSLERFKSEIQGSAVVSGITKFFSVQLSGSCPSWSVDVMVFHIVIDQFCSPGIPWDLIRGIIIAVALFLAARIALS